MYDLIEQSEIEAQTRALIGGKDTIGDIIDYQLEAKNEGIKPWMSVEERFEARQAWLAASPGGLKSSRDAFAFPISGDVIAAEGHLWTTKNLWGMVHESTDEGLDSGDGYFGLPRTAAWQAVVDQSMGRRYFLGWTVAEADVEPRRGIEICRSLTSALIFLQGLMLDHGDTLTKVRLVSRIG